MVTFLGAKKWVHQSLDGQYWQSHLCHFVCIKILMMLPLIDMCNHSFNPNAQIVQEKEARNAELLRKGYGFVIPSNPYDSPELRYDGVLMDAGISFPNFSSPVGWQQQFLSLLKLDGVASVSKKIVTEGNESFRVCRKKKGKSSHSFPF